MEVSEGEFMLERLRGEVRRGKKASDVSGKSSVGPESRGCLYHTNVIKSSK